MARAKKVETQVDMTAEIFDALKMMGEESGIPESYLAEKIRSAIIVAAKKDYGGKDVVFCEMDTEARIFKVYVRKTVVNEIEDQYTQLLLEDALKVDKNAAVGEFVDIAPSQHSITLGHGVERCFIGREWVLYLLFLRQPMIQAAVE